MTSIVLECPHCGAEKIGFSIVFELQVPSPYLGPSMDMFQALLICTSCGGAIVAVFERTIIPGAHGHETPMRCPIDPRQFGFVLSVFPKPEPAKLPSHIPNDELKNYFNQAADSLRRGNWDASGAMSRKVVDVSTKLLLGEAAAKHSNIKDHIDELEKRNRLTPDLQEWAHQVRLGGNDAAQGASGGGEGHCRTEILGNKPTTKLYHYPKSSSAIHINKNPGSHAQEIVDSRTMRARHETANG